VKVGRLTDYANSRFKDFGNRLGCISDCINDSEYELQKNVFASMILQKNRCFL